MFLSNVHLVIEDSKHVFPKLIAKVGQTYSGNNRQNEKIPQGNQTFQINHTEVQFQICKASCVEAKFGIRVVMKECLHDQRLI